MVRIRASTVSRREKTFPEGLGESCLLYWAGRGYTKPGLLYEQSRTPVASSEMEMLPA